MIGGGVMLLKWEKKEREGYTEDEETGKCTGERGVEEAAEGEIQQRLYIFFLRTSTHFLCHHHWFPNQPSGLNSPFPQTKPKH